MVDWRLDAFAGAADGFVSASVQADLEGMLPIVAEAGVGFAPGVEGAAREGR